MLSPQSTDFFLFFFVFTSDSLFPLLHPKTFPVPPTLGVIFLFFIFFFNGVVFHFLALSLPFSLYPVFFHFRLFISLFFIIHVL